jgi:hypothetical protein
VASFFLLQLLASGNTSQQSSDWRHAYSLDKKAEFEQQLARDAVL